VPLEEAARQAGIPLGEVYQYVEDRSITIDTLNFELRLAGQRAIRKALTKLSKLATGGQRPTETSETVKGDGYSELTTEKLTSDDLEAAKALAKFGIDALKLARSGGAKDDSGGKQTDLFDKQPNPWSLKDIE
jgi:hypothetical protein